jgi:hypothetical protein
VEFYGLAKVWEPTIIEPYIATVELDFVRFMYAGQIREFLSLMGDMVAGYDSRTETERRIDREMINELGTRARSIATAIRSTSRTSAISESDFRAMAGPTC